MLANRLLITVREKYYSYRKELDDIDTFTTMRFQTAAPQVEDEDIALETFADAATTTRSRRDNVTVRGGYDLGIEQFSESRGF